MGAGEAAGEELPEDMVEDGALEGEDAAVEEEPEGARLPQFTASIRSATLNGGTVLLPWFIMAVCNRS